MSDERALRPIEGRSPLAGAAFAALALVLVVAAALLVSTDGSGTTQLFSTEAWRRASRFIGDLVGRSSSTTPAYRLASQWSAVARASIATLASSILAAAMAGAGALLTLPLGARPRADRAPGRLQANVGRAVQGVYVLTRTVPELVWALLVVFVVRPGPLAAALALGMHNFGVLGRLATDIVEDLDPGPGAAVRSAGARPVAVLTYSTLPQLLPKFITFLLYRWEVIIRTTIVVGFVAGSGLGREFRLALSFFRYTQVTTILLAYVALVWLVDGASAALRRLAR